MALLTELTLEDCQALGALYGLDIARSEALSGGSVNSNFLWEDRRGTRFFARLYEEQDFAGAAREAAVGELLAEALVPVARPVRRRDGTFLSDCKGKPLALFVWVHGEWLCQARVTPAHCRAVGQALARVHLVPVRPDELGAGRFGVQALKQRLVSVAEAGAGELGAAARRILQELDVYAVRRDESLPQGLVHGDLFRDNCLWQQMEIQALIDFESASYGAFVFDLMVTVLAWCYADAFVPELVEALVSSYHEVRPLTGAEIAAAPIEAALGCLRFATTRITDYSLRAPPGTPPLRDYRRFLWRLAAVEQGSLEAVLGSLTPRPLTPATSAADRGPGAKERP